jgi:hypothetical protein
MPQHISHISTRSTSPKTSPIKALRNLRERDQNDRVWMVQFMLKD